MPRRKKVEIQLEGLPKVLGAEVYSESSVFICLIPDTNLIGRGETVADAINAWDINLKAHLRNAAEDDSIVQKAKTLINGSVQDDGVPSVVKGKVKVDIKKTREENMAEFEAQFIPPKRFTR